MRERLAALGGSVRTLNLPQRGFELDIAVPLGGAHA
jgi:signal transduction histidine kinase